MLTSKSSFWFLMLTVVAVLSVACGGDDPTPTPTPSGPEPPPPPDAFVTLTEWAITEQGGGGLALAGRTDVTFEVRNEGGQNHQLAVWQGGVVEDDEVNGGTQVGLTAVGPGETTTLRLEDLASGTYLLTCPIPGHTLLGMHTELVISGG
ncbi:MAG: sulfocyanin-like copper-binding protein [Dehalococcoidia bacterium]